MNERHQEILKEFVTVDLKHATPNGTVGRIIIITVVGILGLVTVLLITPLCVVKLRNGKRSNRRLSLDEQLS